MGGINGVGVSNGREPIGAGGLTVSQEDLTTKGHSMGELTMSHGPQVS